MPFYEHVFIARQEISSQQVENLTQEFTKHITDGGGKVTKTEYWGLKTLAYKVKKNRKGHYVLLNIDAPHAAVAEMERNQGLNEDILRHMTLRMEELEEGPSVMMKVRDRRDDRDRRHSRPPQSDHAKKEGAAPGSSPTEKPASTETAQVEGE